MNLMKAYRITPLVLILLVSAVTQGWGAPAQQTQKRSVEGLIYDLKHPEAEKRKEAARLLGQHRIREAVPAMLPMTKDSDPSVRLEVARALVRINDTRALDSFVQLTRDSDKAIRKVAVEGIVKIYVVEQKGFVDGVKEVVRFINPLSDNFNPLTVEPYIPVSEKAITALADLLFDEDRGLRKDAAEALGILRGRSALPAIQAALEKEENNDIKVALIRAVYKIGDRTAGVSLVPLIRDPDKQVHDEAILAAGRLKVAEAVPSLNEIYSAGIEERKKIFGFVPVSGSDDLQKKVLEALAYIADARSQEIFEDALNDERDHYRRYGAEGLGRLAASDFQTLIARQYLREKSSSVKLALGFTLLLMGRDEHIIELVDNIKKDQAYYYLMELPPSKFQLLQPYVQTEDASTKVRLLNVLGLSGDASWIPLVEEMTRDEDVDVASAANLALRRLRGRFPDA